MECTWKGSWITHGEHLVSQVLPSSQRLFPVQPCLPSPFCPLCCLLFMRPAGHWQGEPHMMALSHLLSPRTALCLTTMTSLSDGSSRELPGLERKNSVWLALIHWPGISVLIVIFKANISLDSEELVEFENKKEFNLNYFFWMRKLKPIITQLINGRARFKLRSNTHQVLFPQL